MNTNRLKMKVGAVLVSGTLAFGFQPGVFAFESAGIGAERVKISLPSAFLMQNIDLNKVVLSNSGDSILKGKRLPAPPSVPEPAFPAVEVLSGQRVMDAGDVSRMNALRISMGFSPERGGAFISIAEAISADCKGQNSARQAFVPLGIAGKATIQVTTEIKDMVKTLTVTLTDN